LLNVLRLCAKPNGGTSGPLRLDLAALGIRFVVAAIFVYASTDKILHPAAFAKMVYNYQILPDGLINATAIVLPWLELFLGILLLFGVWQPGAVLGANALLIAFFGALVFDGLRGLDVVCGCFSTSPGYSQGSMAWYLVRDGLFLLMGAFLFWRTFCTKTQVGRAPIAGRS
jgi:uncharacterized membrane protein YphA (DoxX/SURF4 family)